MKLRALARTAAEVGSASLCGTLALIALLGAAGCSRPSESTVVVRTLAAPETGEHPCAWFGDAFGGTLYFGIAAFWSSYHDAGGDPVADLQRTGPQQIGRFDLARRTHLSPLPVAASPQPTGVWDVLASEDGRIYFTTFFGSGSAGVLDLASGVAQRFENAGEGLNELAAGPSGTLLVTRYFGAPGGGGSVVQLSRSGEIVAEHELSEPPGLRVAAKSLGFDPLREEIWVNTDLVAADRPPAHDTRVLDIEGREQLRFAEPELQFVAFDPDGTGWFALADGRRLVLRIRTPEQAAEGPQAGRVVVLDERFEPEIDFVQDLKPAPGGRIVVTRWSGRIHVVDRNGQVRDVALPVPPDPGIYYSTVLSEGRLCATHCGAITVVCNELETQ